VTHKLLVSAFEFGNPIETFIQMEIHDSTRRACPLNL
jgi:hypothetical protein